MDDEQLRAALAADLDAAFEPLVLAYQDRLYRFGLRLAGSPQDAEEVAQDALVRAYRALAGYTAERIRALALRTWLYQIALNVFRNRTRRHRPETIELNGHAESVHDLSALPEAAAETAEQGAELTQALDALPVRYRTAVVLRHVEELSIAEIAAVMDMPEGTVKSHIHRGIGMLRTAVVKEMHEVTR